MTDGTSVTLDLNSSAAIMRDLMNEPSYGKALGIITDAMASEAKARAPVEHGDYRDGIHGAVVSGSEGFEGALVGENWKTVLLEWGVSGAGRSGEVNIPATHNFQNAAKAVGLGTGEE